MLIIPLRLLLAPRDELRGYLRDASALEARGVEGDFVGRGRAVVALEGDAVGVAGLELYGVCVAWADDERAPVVEGVVEREYRRLLTAVRGRGARERRADFVDERARGPERPGHVEELF